MKRFIKKPIYSATDADIIYKDADGAFGERDKFYTKDEITEIWEDLHDRDQVMSQYESFESWWEDTEPWFKAYKLTAI